MKKILAFVSALIVMGGVACAGDFYNGDIQIQLGLGLNKATIEDVSKDIDAKEFNFGLQSWHLFKPLDMLGVGFMGGFNIGAGKTENWKEPGNVSGITYEDGMSASFNYEIGPAVGLYLANIVRFGFNIGYNAGLDFETPSNYEIKDADIKGYTNVSAFYSGISLGLQAKFFPESKVNPVVGWRFVKGSADTVEITSYATGSDYNSDSYNKKYDFTQNVLYAAISFSW